MSISPLERRSAGILLHLTSLPGPGPTGDLGPSARRFVDFLAEAGQSFWQMLPVHPVGGGDSPYDSPSAFAGAPHLVSIEDLIDDGLLEASALPLTLPRPDRADFARAASALNALHRAAYARFESHPTAALSSSYDAFVSAHSSWVWDFALFSALKQRYEGRPWFSWPRELGRREPGALERAHQELASEVRYHVFLQFCFHRQWSRLRAHAQGRGVAFLGDVPMFVAHDSVDVWANQHAFFLDEDGRRTVQAGVPPDYFSEDGQLWGNPLYRWDVMRNDGYGWWIDRLRRELEKFDAIRLDHFIAFHRYWEVPIGAENARSGRYVDGPRDDFFHAARRALGSLPFVAEDLGIVTREVEELRDRLELPGMKVLEFAFHPGAEGYLPHRHGARNVVYTGTHDNDTARGWYDSLLARSPNDADAAVELERVQSLTGARASDELAPALIRLLYASPAKTAIVPLQDVLNQGTAFRMNVPGVAEGNWTYRFREEHLTPELARELARLAVVTERAPATATV